MQYKILYDNPNEHIISRLLKIRNIDDTIEDFLHPTLEKYWISPFLLNDMEKGVQRIIKAMKNKEKIMIFWDYDVDGITSSYILYTFVRKYLKYPFISIQYPHRIKDGYGIKKHHIDTIKEKEVSLIITVDNGIASLEEALYARKHNIDLIITDHHQDLEKIPEATAVINPQISPNYPFKWLAWVWVTFKLICALLEKSNFSTQEKQDIYKYFLPIVTIWTIADVVPLIWENRAMIKKWLEIINKRTTLPKSLKWLLDYLNITGSIDTYHIGYIIWPRINAWGRIASPYDSLYALLYSWEKQLQCLDRLETINTQRKQIQEEMFKKAEQQIDFNQKILIAYDESFHEWIVGIVAGKITEKYHKPSMIMKIDHTQQVAIASLRWPEYFSVIDLLKHNHDILERFWWHKWAWGLTIKLEKLPLLIKRCITYCNQYITDNDLQKYLTIDTKLYAHERTWKTGENIQQLAPFGEGNIEPIFLLENIAIQYLQTIGNNGKSHKKIHGKFGKKDIEILFRNKWNEMKEINQNSTKFAQCWGKIFFRNMGIWYI